MCGTATLFSLHPNHPTISSTQDQCWRVWSKNTERAIIGQGHPMPVKPFLGLGNLCLQRPEVTPKVTETKTNTKSRETKFQEFFLRISSSAMHYLADEPL